MRGPWVLVLLMLASLGAGCGGGVQMLRFDDARLPLESRRWIADAEDGVLVARSWRDRAEAELEATGARAEALARDAEALRAAGAGDAAQNLAQVSAGRLDVAEQELELAEAGLRMAQAKRDRINAETAMRHDLAVYELEPLRRASEAALTETRRLRAQLDRARDELETRTTAWWESYGRWVGTSNRRELLWLR